VSNIRLLSGAGGATAGGTGTAFTTGGITGGSSGCVCPLYSSSYSFNSFCLFSNCLFLTPNSLF